MPVLPIPLSIEPLPHQWIMRQVELQRRDGDVTVAEIGDIRVFLGRAEGEDAAVPVVALPARAFALFVGVDPRPRALAADFDAGGLLAGAQAGHVDARDLPGAES